jgi:signal transduction histidine kinase/ActR/RegA family two-component response regulator/SAM-dependent methyltransferase
MWLPLAALPSVHAACEAAVQHAGARGRVRVWVPGCRTGGMAYAVAMLLIEAAAELSSPARVTVFATDDDEEALTLARAGRYPARAIVGMDLDLRVRYTVDEGESVRVSEELRETCIFSRHKLTHDTPMTRMDLVVCQRIFDGIAATRRAQLVEALHGSLRDGGLLLALDHGDGFLGERFEEVEPGLLRALPASSVGASAPPSHMCGVQRVDVGVPPSAGPPRWPRPRAGEPWTLAPFLHTIGVPLLLCDSRLRLLFASAEAMVAFGLSDTDTGRPLDALSAQLPGSADLVPLAWRASENQAAEELSIRAWGKVYLAHVSAAAPGVSIVFSDVTQLELAHRKAVAQQQLELEVSRLLAGASSLQAVGQGLRRAFGMLPGVERAEIWSEAPSSASGWVQLVPEGGSTASTPPWTEALSARFDADPLQIAGSGSAREIWVAIAGRDVPLAVLYLAGKGLGTPDTELAAGLRRVARTLADFLERSSILERSRRNITELEQVEATLREADQQKDDFLAMLGHELRNPMAAIRNATELLSRLEQPTPQLLRLQSIFDRQTLQTTKLIDGLLDVARVARGKVELQMGPVQVIELVQQVLDDRRQQFQERQLELQLPDQPALWVEADRVRLVQILDNLISNALKFTHPGGRIRVEVACAQGRGSLRVEDDGQGIEAELLPQIFEPFRQGRAITAQAQAGLGLGLALVKGLVELHGFQLRAESPGRDGGATFLVEFPLAEAPESKGPESHVEMRVLELLLVEDNADIAETLAELLAAAGHQVAIVGSAERAIEHLCRHRPHVVLCDIGLPGMDGLELAARLREDPGLAQLKLVAMTGFGDASTQARVQEAGFDRMLIKPVRLDALRQCLSRVMAASVQRVAE